MATATITCTECAEIDSQYQSQNETNSFDIGGFGNKENRSYAFFDISDIPVNAVITGASVELRQYGGEYYDAGITIRCRICSEYISNGAITWNNQPETGSVYADLDITSNTGANRTWTLPTAENINNYRVNGRLILHFYGLETSENSLNAKGFRPSGNGTDSPELTLEYIMPSQVNVGGAWKYIEGFQVNVGDAWKTVQSIQANVGDVWKTVF